MRLDKYLKVSRLIKRRSVAADACLASRIKVNDKDAKPSKEVAVGDVIQILFGANSLTVCVTSLAEFTKKEEATLLYEVIK